MYFLRRGDLGRIKTIQRQQKYESIDSFDSLCADLGRFHFNATFRFFYALRRPKEIMNMNIDPLQATLM